MTDFSNQAKDYQRIEQAIRFIEANFKNQPSLDQIAASVNLSKYHFDRLFKRWAGISPVRFLHFLTIDYTKKRLQQSQNLLETSLDAGLSGPGRLHDLFIAFEAMTPGTYKKKGSGLTIHYGFFLSPFGECLLAVTEKGICHLSFVENIDRPAAVNRLHQAWPQALFEESATRITPVAGHLFQPLPANTKPLPGQPLHLHLRGTNFQINIWRALLTIPSGHLVTYKDVAGFIGHPKACRAAAAAIAANPIAYLIPCHRVIAATGKIHQYRWGTARKKALIGWEASAPRLGIA